MNAFRKQNKVFDVTAEITQISSQLRGYDTAKEAETAKLAYLDNLENYLQTKTNYTEIAAPTSVGIQEGNILSLSPTHLKLQVMCKGKSYVITSIH